MQYVTHGELTQKSTMSVSCSGPVGNNGSSASVLYASGDLLDLVLWHGVPFNDDHIFQFRKRVEWKMIPSISSV
jgi:hypothetical protein